MNVDELELSVRPALAAQGHLIALALVSALRDKPDAAATMEEMAKAFIQEWIAATAKSNLPDTARNALTAEYTEVMMQIINLAVSMLNRIRPIS